MKEQKENIVDEMESLFDETTKCEIRLKALKEKLWKKQELVKKFSTFESSSIGYAIAELVTKISGREFEYQSVRSTCPRMINEGPYAGDYEMKSRDELLVIDNTICKGHYWCETGDITLGFARKGDAIRLSTETPKTITFYQYGTRECKNGGRAWFFGFDVDLYGHFDYVKKFIDALVAYRFENKLDKIDEATILAFVDEFAAGYQKQVQDSRIKLTNKPKGE